MDKKIFFILGLLLIGCANNQPVIYAGPTGGDRSASDAAAAECGRLADAAGASRYGGQVGEVAKGSVRGAATGAAAGAIGGAIAGNIGKARASAPQPAQRCIWSRDYFCRKRPTRLIGPMSNAAWLTRAFRLWAGNSHAQQC